MTKDPEFDLDALLAEARDTPAAPRPDFVTSMAAVAVEHTPHVVAAPAQKARWGWFQLLGGWPAGAGLVAAAFGGVMIGINPPDAVATYAAAALDAPTVWELSGYSDLGYAFDEGVDQ